MNVQGKLWLKHKCASFAEGDQRAVSYWPHLQLLQLAGEGLLWHSFCGPREAAGKSWQLSGPIWGGVTQALGCWIGSSQSSCGALVLMVIDHMKLTSLGMCVRTHTCVCVWLCIRIWHCSHWTEWDRGKGNLTLGLSRKLLPPGWRENVLVPFEPRVCHSFSNSGYIKSHYRENPPLTIKSY